MIQIYIKPKGRIYKLKAERGYAPADNRLNNRRFHNEEIAEYCYPKAKKGWVQIPHRHGKISAKPVNPEMRG